MRFEWDAAKAKANVGKHRVSFEESESVFDDMFALTSDDVVHSETEDRRRTVGRSERGRVLVVITTRRGDVMRIISVRRAATPEVRAYEIEVERRLRGER
jgi:uncharacterized protein